MCSSPPRSVIASILEADGIAADRIVTVHDGVNVGLVDKQPAVDAHAAFWLPKGAPVVGNVAALAAAQGPETSRRRRGARGPRVPDARFLIVGEGELRETLERQIHELGLDRHVLLGGFRADALGLMKSFDLFVMSSVTEGLGSAMLEAMANRRPVVGTRAGGIPEAVVDGVTGLLVPPHDDRALAEAIVRSSATHARRSGLATPARAGSREFSVERMVERTLEVYRRRLEARDARG